jgi:hypothetical protein
LCRQGRATYREAVEKLLQREGKTVIKLIDRASQLGFNTADELFEMVGKDVSVHRTDCTNRQGLPRDISELFTKEKMNVTRVLTQSIRGSTWMTFIVEVADSGRQAKVLGSVAELRGMCSERRR